MKFYSYVITSDNGFAPNPFYGYCTLATCKPAIRRKAEIGDWLIGTGSVENVGNDRLIYAMEVTDKISLEDYSEDKRFAKKIPAKGAKRNVGDNIYYRDTDGTIRQRFPSAHSYEDRENPKTKKHDWSGRNVLISKSGSYYYFGRGALRLPKELQCLVKKGPAHKCNFQNEVTERFLAWIKKRKPGIHGKPCNYSESSRCKARKRRIAGSFN